MTSSGTYNFQPSNADVLFEAFERCDKPAAGLTAPMLVSARRSLNLLLSEWSNKVPLFWEISLQTITLVQGVASYTLPASTAAILDVYITNAQGNDTLLYPMSRTDYASQPNKTHQAKPTSYWYDQLINPVITMWPVPDLNGPYILNCYTMKQSQDANVGMGETPYAPYRFFEPLCAGLAMKLCVKFAADKYPLLKSEYDRVLQDALDNDRERVPLYIRPETGRYFR